MAADDEILTLLREIRDIQQQHLETYRTQAQRSIVLSTLAVKRQRLALLIVIPIFALVTWYLWARPDMSQWKEVQDRSQQQLDQFDRQWERWDARHRGVPNDDARVP